MNFSLFPFPGAKAGGRGAKKGMKTHICPPRRNAILGGFMGEKQDIESQILA